MKHGVQSAKPMTPMHSQRAKKGFPTPKKKWVREGWAPTTREIATYFGVHQTAAMGYLERLEDKKAITRQPNSARAIKIL